MSRIKFGYLFSALWLIIGGLLFYLFYDPNIEINELGDFIAGFVAPLAFIWFIIAYYQQGEELKLNTKALKEQQKELKKQFEALDEQVSALKHTSEALKNFARPFLTVFIRRKHHNVDLIIKNHGLRPALNPKFKFSKSLTEIGRDNIDHKSFLNIKSIAPGEEIYHHLNLTFRLVSEVDELNYQSHITQQYQDVQGNSYEEEYDINITVVNNEIIDSPDIETSLKKISGYLKDIKKALRKQ